jgi:hypothetical protein
MAEQDWEKRFAALEARLARLEQALAPPSVPRNGEEAFPTISDSAIDEIFEVRPVAGGPVAETPRPRDELGELIPLAEIASPIESAEAARATPIVRRLPVHSQARFPRRFPARRRLRRWRWHTEFWNAWLRARQPCGPPT